MDSLASGLLSDGFDVVQPFRVSWYNDLLKSLGLATDEEHVGGSAFTLAPLPDYGRGGDALCLLIGNSRAMWPKFLEWLRAKQDPASVKDPVDTYTSEAISKAIKTFTETAESGRTVACDIFWSADMRPERLVDMNRVSLVSGACYFSDELFLSVHPTFGSWVGFRAVVVLDMPATHLGEPPPRVPPLLSAAEEAAARTAFAEAMEASAQADLSVDGMPLELAQKWAALRDCVALGREHKYSTLQSEYHYTKDKAVLLRAVAQEEVES